MVKFDVVLDCMFCLLVFGCVFVGDCDEVFDGIVFRRLLLLSNLELLLIRFVKRLRLFKLWFKINKNYKL